MTSKSRLVDAELDFDVDALAVAKDGIPCPVPWCNAHVHRHGACGDDDGDYAGTHRGRVKAQLTWPRKKAKEVEQLRNLGIPDPEMCVGVVQLTRDAQNAGMVPGKTREMRRHERVKKQIADFRKKEV